MLADRLLGLLLVLGLGLFGAAIAVVLVMAATALIGWLGVKYVGGQTGDVLGALQQTSEILILLVAAATL